MGQLILLIGQFMMRILPKLGGVLLKMPLLTMAIGIGVSTLLACSFATNALYDALAGLASSSPDAWCIATAFGVQLGVWWFLQGVTVGLGIFAFKVLKEPVMQVVAELGSLAK